MCECVDGDGTKLTDSKIDGKRDEGKNKIIYYIMRCWEVMSLKVKFKFIYFQLSYLDFKERK